MSGEALIAAPRERVYAALNDIEILRQSIPGCETIEWESDNEMTATVVAKVGPVKAKFAGRVTLSDRIPPEGYTISGEGKGGAAGFAKGGATVRLTAHRWHSQEDGGRVLRQFQRGGRSRRSSPGHSHKGIRDVEGARAANHGT
jgi:carbon monoxide dehydrogenase subunit G